MSSYLYILHPDDVNAYGAVGISAIVDIRLYFSISDVSAIIYDTDTTNDILSTEIVLHKLSQSQKNSPAQATVNLFFLFNKLKGRILTANDIVCKSKTIMGNDIAADLCKINVASGVCRIKFFKTVKLDHVLRFSDFNFYLREIYRSTRNFKIKMN